MLERFTELGKTFYLRGHRLIVKAACHSGDRDAWGKVWGRGTGTTSALPLMGSMTLSRPLHPRRDRRRVT